MGCSHDDRTPSRVPVGLLDDRRGVGADHTADGHEEAASRCAISQCSSLLLRLCTHATHPNVAPDAPMYWPKVLMIPLGPAPYRKILTVPKGACGQDAGAKRMGKEGCRGVVP